MKGIDRFKGGLQSAREKLNRLVDAVNPIRSLRGDQFIRVTRTADAVAIGLMIDQILARIPKRTSVASATATAVFVKLTSVAGSSPPFAYSGEEVEHDGTIYFEPVADHWDTPSYGMTFSGNLFSLAELDSGGTGLYKMAVPSVVVAWSVGNGYYVFERHFPCGAYQ